MALALLGLVEHALFLTPMTLNGLVMDLATSQLFFTDYRFDTNTKMVPAIELDGNRPVAFRLSANITHFLDASIEGHFNGALIAIARCINSRRIEHLLRPILWDIFAREIENHHHQQNGGNDAIRLENLSATVKQALDTILTRTKQLAQFEGGHNPTMGSLLMTSQLADNLCRMACIYP